MYVLLRDAIHVVPAHFYVHIPIHTTFSASIIGNIRATLYMGSVCILGAFQIVAHVAWIVFMHPYVSGACALIAYCVLLVISS